MHNFLDCAYISHDFAESQNIFARSHDRETVTFRNSAFAREIWLTIGLLMSKIVTGPKHTKKVVVNSV